MTRRPATSDPVGFLAVDKPPGITSHDVVSAVRRAARMRRVGHAGTLDPMATGLLVVGLGPATRLIRYVQAGTKRYVADVVFGIATDSLDADGDEVERSPMPVSKAEIVAAARGFVGVIEQVPPMVSAKKRDGVRLYELARQGVEVEREPVSIEVHAIDVTGFVGGEFPTATLDIRCGTGTYIRTLGDDIARSLGGRAHLSALRRTEIGSISVNDAITLERITDEGVDPHLLSPAAALHDLPAVMVDDEEASAVGHGRPLDRAASGASPVRVLDDGGRLLAVYRPDGSRIVPETVLPVP